MDVVTQRRLKASPNLPDEFVNGQPNSVVFPVLAILCLFSVDARADDVGLIPLPGEQRFADPSFASAAATAAEGRFQRAERRLRARMKRVRASVENGFHGRDPALRRRILDRFAVGERPTMIVSDGRFWFQGDVYRLGAALAQRRAAVPRLARYLTDLLRSGQATPEDRAWARACLAERDHPPLRRALQALDTR